MKYRDVKTGAIIETNCVVSGSWEPVEEEKKTKAKAKKEAKDDE